MSAASVNCPRCGTVLRPSAPEGLCPRCLGALNFATETVLPGEEKMVAQPPLTPEQLAVHFPQLEIIECLGRGGMGVVYRARQKSLNRMVALKLLAPERVQDAKFAERFAHEAQALAKLSHPNIVTIHDFGEAGGFYFLLMEFVDGVNLRQLLRSRKLTPEEALAIVPPLCDALQFAHERGIVHRDIKPENLLLDKDGRVKVADFGIAKMLSVEKIPTDSEQPRMEKEISGRSEFVGIPAPSVAAGTPGYMAPEQKTAPQKVDARADIYSLGVVFYEMLTGELPGAKLQPPSKKVQIDVRLDEIVLRALEQTPELRYQTAGEMRTQLETLTSSNSKRGTQNAEPSARILKTSGLLAWAWFSDWSGAARCARTWPGRRPIVYGLMLALGLIAAGMFGIERHQRALKRAFEVQAASARQIPAVARPEFTLGPARSLAGPPFIARLPDGGSIELLAVRNHPSTNEPWWQPDGSPSTYDAAIEAELKEQVRPGVMALARITYPTNHEHWPKSPDDAQPAALGLGNGPRFAVKNGRRMPMTESDASPNTVFGVICFENVLARGNEATLFVPVATAEWQTLTVQQPGGLLSRFFDPVRKDWKFSATPLGNLKVSITHLSEIPGMEYRLVAVDLDGKRFAPPRTTRSKKSTENFSSFEAEFDGAGGGTVGLPFNRIREIRWEGRPYQQVEFRNVSLEPGHRTTVEVMDFADHGVAAQIATPGAPVSAPARPAPPQAGPEAGVPMAQQATDGGLSLFSPVVGEGVGSNEFRAVTTIIRPRHVAVLTFEVESAQGRVEVPELSYYAVAFAPPLPFATLASWSVETRPDGLTSFRMTSNLLGSWSSRPLNGLLDYVWKATPPDRSFWVGPGEWHLNDTNTLSIFEGVSRHDPKQRAIIRLQFSLFALPENYAPTLRGQLVQPGQNWRAGLGLEPNVPFTVTRLSPPGPVSTAGIGVPWFAILLGLAVLFFLGVGAVVLVVVLRRRNGSTVLKVLAVVLGAGMLFVALAVGLLWLYRISFRPKTAPAIQVQAKPAPPIAGKKLAQQIDFKVTRVENPPGTRNIVLHFERDANPGLGIEVWQDVRPSQAGQQPAPGYRTWQQKYRVDVNGPRTLSWVLPQEFTAAEARALAKEMERKWKRSRPLPDGAVPEFGTAVHREGWKYHLLGITANSRACPTI